MVEATLLVPWFLFLFVGALDFGFYSYALISVQNAARVAALKTAAIHNNYVQALSDPASVRPFACRDVRDELAKMPNFGSMPADCGSSPLDVNVAAFSDGDGLPAMRVSVTYDTITLIPIPALVPKALKITRTSSVRVYGGS